MRKFKYISLNYKGKIKKSISNFESQTELLKFVSQKGEYLIEANEIKSIYSFQFKRKMKESELSIICRHISSALESGIGILPALELVSKQMKKTAMLKKFNQVIEYLQQGLMLHEALNTLPEFFPKFMIDMVNIGENTGSLDLVFSKLSNHYYEENRFRQKLIGAATYPAFIFITCLITVSILMVAVVPSMAYMITNLGGQLPLATKIILAISTFFKENIFEIIFFIFALIIVTYYFTTKNKIDWLLIMRPIPFLGRLYVQKELYKIIEAVAILYGSGCSILRTLEITYEIIDSNHVKQQMIKAIKVMKEGGSVYEAFSSIDIMDELTISFINLGEDTGKLDFMLTKLLKILKEDIDIYLEKIMRLIEPMAILIIGVLVGGIIISIVMPMFSLYNSI